MDAATCAEVLGRLVADRFLTRTRAGAYVRMDGCDMHAQPCRRALCAWHPEFAMEAALLAGFMIAALAFSVLLEHPASPVRHGGRARRSRGGS